MALIDPTTSIGKLRLRVGDFSDLPMFPDEVYNSALADCNNNIPKASVLMAQYILALLTAQTHQKLAQLEVYGSEWFNNYLKFINKVILNPNFMDIAPMPYVATYVNEEGCESELPLVEFQKLWNSSYVNGTSIQDMRSSMF